MKIRGEILDGHKGAAVEVPFDPSERWGAAITVGPRRRGHAVRVRRGDVTFDSAIVARSSRFWLLLPEEGLRALGASVGEVVSLEIDGA